MHNGQLINSNL